jgi:hypothetical protein
MNNNSLPTSMIQDMILGLVKSSGDFRHGMSLGSKGSEDLQTLMNQLKGRMDEQSYNNFVTRLDQI